MTSKRFLTALTILLLWQLCAGAALARVITDMGGRQVTVPDRISRVFATAPPAMYMVYALGPDLLVGLNSAMSEAGRGLLDPRVFELPVLGGWFGQGRMANREALLQARPEVVVSFRWRSQAVQWKIEQTLEPLGLPVVGVSIQSLADYPAVFRFLGELFNRQERGEALARYAERTLAAMARLRQDLPPAEKLVVYYAEGAQGLQTECDSSFHAELINICGGVNPHHCQATNIAGMNQISLEQILAYDPQVILTHDAGFYAAVKQDPRWSRVRAVRQGRVYLIPRRPINWFDRPPSFMGLLGAHWLAHQLYPARHPVDLTVEAQEFFRLFLGVEVDQAAAAKLLEP